MSHEVAAWREPEIPGLVQHHVSWNFGEAYIGRIQGREISNDPTYASSLIRYLVLHGPC